MERWLTRQEIYDLVWAEPVSTAAKRFGVSDVAFAKACRAADIPIPDRGYWAKRQAGKPVYQPRLPPRRLGCSDWAMRAKIDLHDPVQTDAERLTEPLPSAPTFTQSVAEVTARAHEAVGHPTVPKGFSRLHPAIKRLLDADERRRKQLEASGYRWDGPLFGSAYEQRRLAFLNALGLALSAAGGGLSVRGCWRGCRAASFWGWARFGRKHGDTDIVNRQAVA